MLHCEAVVSEISTLPSSCYKALNLNACYSVRQWLVNFSRLTPSGYRVLNHNACYSMRQQLVRLQPSSYRSMHIAVVGEPQ